MTGMRKTIDEGRYASIGVVLDGRLRTIALAVADRQAVLRYANDRGVTAKNLITGVVDGVRADQPGRTVDALAAQAGVTVSQWLRLVMLTYLGRIALHQHLDAAREIAT